MENKKFWTAYFYFPDTNIDKNHGTIIYEKINNEIKIGNRVEYEGFDEILK